MYKVIEHYNDKNVVDSYGIAFKFLWWWLPCGAVGYFHKADAEKACSGMNGGSRLADDQES